MLGRPDHQANGRNTVREHHAQLIGSHRVRRLVIRVEMDMHVRQPGIRNFPRPSTTLAPSGTAMSIALPTAAIRPSAHQHGCLPRPSRRPSK